MMFLPDRMPFVAKALGAPGHHRPLRPPGCRLRARRPFRTFFSILSASTPVSRPMSVATRLPTSHVQHVDALPPGTRLCEFEVRALLGVGGFGMVYEAFDHSLQRLVAIKEYMPAKLAGRADGHSLWVRSSSNEQSFQAGLASFVDEARLLARFDHPSLVKVLRFWEANHTAYMVMPLYRGMTLKQARAHMRTPPPEAWLRQLLWSVTSALRVLHDGQTLHRDISPDNIFLQDCGPPVLLDLGAARHTIGGGSDRHAAVLKVNYAPLEQYADAVSEMGQGPWSDLYALGALVHGYLCNDTPLPATQRALRDRMVPFSRVARTVNKQFGFEYSPSFVAAIGQCLALQPQDRPQSVAAFTQAMGMKAAPQGLECFDFRAALGDIWVEPQARDAQGVAVPMMAPLLQSQSHAMSRALGHGLQATSTEAPQESVAPTCQPVAQPQRPGVRVRAKWAMAASVAAVAIAGSLWLELPEQPQHAASEGAIPTDAADAQASQVPALSEMQQTTTSRPRPQPNQGRAAYILPATDAVVARPAPTQRAAESAPLLPDSAMVRAIREASARVPDMPQLLAAPADPLEPQEACASVGFFARPGCIQRTCQAATMANHPVCEESRRRQEARELRQLYAQ